MKWKKYTIYTTTEAEDLVSLMLNENGVEGVQIENNVPLSDADTKGMFIDILPEIGEDDGRSRVSFFLHLKEEDGRESTVQDPDADHAAAYAKFITALCRMSREAKRVTAKEKEVSNEKYAFRCFLLRLGFIGAEYKKDRKILLENLTGSSAFRNGGAGHEVSE